MRVLLIPALACLSLAACNRPGEAPDAATNAVDAAAVTTDAASDSGSMTASGSATSGNSASAGAPAENAAGTSGTASASPVSTGAMASGQDTRDPVANPQVPGGAVSTSDPVPVAQGYATQGPRSKDGN